MTKTKIYNPYNWKVVYNNDNDDVKNLTVHLESEQEKDSLKGEVLAERLKDKSLNSNALKKLLDNPKTIPDEWKKYYGVYFWGTILRDPNGYRYVLCLCWYGGGWRWDASWLGDDWDSSDLSAVLASTLDSELDTKPSDTLNLALAIEEVKKAGYKIYKEI